MLSSVQSSLNIERESYYWENIDIVILFSTCQSFAGDSLAQPPPVLLYGTTFNGTAYLPYPPAKQSEDT